MENDLQKDLHDGLKVDLQSDLQEEVQQDLQIAPQVEESTQEGVQEAPNGETQESVQEEPKGETQTKSKKGTTRSIESLDKQNTIKIEYALDDDGEYKFFVYDRTIVEVDGKLDYVTTDYAVGSTLFEAMQRFDQYLMKHDEGKVEGDICFGLIDEKKVESIEKYLKLRNGNNELSRALYIDLFEDEETKEPVYQVTAEDTDCSEFIDNPKCPSVSSTYKEKKKLSIYEECPDLSSALFNMNDTIKENNLDKVHSLAE